MKYETTKKTFVVILLLALTATLFLCGCGGGQTQQATEVPMEEEQSTDSADNDAAEEATTADTADIEPLTVRSGYTYNAGSLQAIFFQGFQDYVTELSDGAITFDTYWGGSLVGADDALDSIGTGVVDIGNGLPVRTPTLTPFAGASFYFPFRPENLAETYEIMNALIVNFPEFVENVEQYNVKVLSIVPTSGMNLCSTTPITSYKDLAGLKIAAAGADYNVWEAAGAVVVSVAGDARYENLQRNIVDASYLDIASFYTDHSYEVAPYITYTGLGDLATVQFWANTDFWAGLSSGQQAIFEQAIDLAMADYIESADEYIENAVAEMEAAGVTFYTLSDEDRAEWASIMDNLPLQFAASLDEQGLPGTEFVQAFIQTCENAGHVWNRDWLADLQ